ncbi:probable disease resistance protein At4g27220 isoform X2 [Prosopis cineraria]|uniref:probable disease resistance protein At4g27220 isoform X2 n=1 Tax=Prosopis cineraria TaxID=364024 RepID=UPI002410B0AE|nr:probable disease resistance protein At4g27220 isoform X2 [Prosopis cineraria]XP_054793391.1 probable disease resistance protein At4g27220 isoform X2 [Prosopis cineraria]
MEYVTAIFGKVFDVIVEPVTRQLGYLYYYRSNVQELGRCAEVLRAQRQSLTNRVRAAERNGENIDDQVTNWLENMEQKIAEIEDFQKDEGHRKTGCCNGSFPNNLRLRHKLGRKAKKMIPLCTNLLQQPNFATFSYRPEPEASDVALYDEGYEPFKSRDDILEEVMKALRDPAIKMIGIWGQGGVGKTTLVKAVARKAKAEKLFNVVIMANITSTPDVRKVQGEMAAMLGLTLDDETDIGRASRLRERLKKKKENTLVILDDLWARFELSMLGILSKDDDTSQMTVREMPSVGHNQMIDDRMASDSNQMIDDRMASDSKSYKVLLTSRRRDVLSSEMGVKDSIFTVDVMEQEESEKLFNKVVGVTNEDYELKSLSTKIVQKCANLPLAIVATGKALKINKNKVSWENALQRLEKEMIEELEPVEFSTKLSYDHLKGEMLKSIFLLCARLGKEPSIMFLVKYCIGLAIFEGVNTIKEVQARTNESIEKLKNSSLLLDTNSPDCVTMHDMIRDAALSIARKEENVFTKSYVNLNVWPDKDKFEKYTAISLHYCNIIDEIPEGMNCPQLKIFHLDSKDPSVKIPDRLFEGMEELRVLIITGIDLSSFPSSIKCLKKLRMLCLEQCVLGENISIIGKLKSLRILSLLGSKFKLLPSELRQLDKLQLLDISSCTKLKVIPSNVISKLKSLEELYMERNLIQWGIDEKTNDNETATLAELSNLQQLRSLHVHIQDITALPHSLSFDKLDSYKIVIGDSKMFLLEDFQMPYKYKASRILALHLKKGNDIHSKREIKRLFKSIEQLFLGEVDGLQKVTYELNVEGFPTLKHLTIRKNSDIQIIIYSTKWEHQAKAFPELQSICLYKLESLEKVCNCQLTNPSFQSLKTMKIKICGRLRYLFSFCMAKLLTKLETLEVSECDSLENIVVVERQENIGNDTGDDITSFPQLLYLTLQSLSELTCFYANDKKVSTSQMEIVSDCTPLFNSKIFMPKLESLELFSTNIKKVWGNQPLPNHSFENLTKLNVNGCCSLKYLFSFSMVGSLMKLQSLFVRGCDMMKNIFDPEDINTNEAPQEVDIFPQLKKIEITNMEELKTVWHAQAGMESFVSLESVIIEDCHKLVAIFPPYMVGRFHNLDVLEVNNCKLVEEIFNFQSTPETGGGNETNLRVVTLQSLPKLKHVWSKDPQGLLNFKILQHVVVYHCPSLENLFPFSVASDLMKLESVRIWYCDGMKEIVARDDASNRSNFTFKFPKLTMLALAHLAELRCFYQGTDAIEFQALTSLGFGHCDKLEAFCMETTHSEVKPILPSLEKFVHIFKMVSRCYPT